MRRDLYDVLGVRRDADLDTIKSPRVYASNPRDLLQDLESLIQAASGNTPENEPRHVVGSVELDPHEAHVGATRKLVVDAEEQCSACSGSGHDRVVADRQDRRVVSLVDCTECGGGGTVTTQRDVEVPVPPGARDLGFVPVGPREVALVKVVPARERVVVRSAAFAGFAGACGFMLYLMSL